MRLAAGVLAQEVAGDLVLLDTRAGHYFDLNATGSLLLRAWLEGLGEEAAVSRLCQRYAVTPVQARADADALQQELRRRGLLVD